MKVYISGKITSYDIEVAESKFNESEEFLRLKGFTPVNPFKLSETHPDKTWKDYMIDDIRGLFDCDAIYLHSDWGQSKGARIEYQIAKELNLKVMFAGEFLNWTLTASSYVQGGMRGKIYQAARTNERVKSLELQTTPDLHIGGVSG